jgi:hypothetical protein
MTYGCCHLSLIPVRESASDKSEMVNQLVFGDVFEILDTRTKWLKIRNAFDGYEGWIDRKQSFTINENQYQSLKKNLLQCSTDLVEYVQDPKDHLLPIVIGSSIYNLSQFGYKTEASKSQGIQQRKQIVPTALLYLNSPYLWGGKSPFGIDCSGFTQMVYKICGFKLKRDASQQALQGENLSFIEEAQPGDLAFFDNTEGDIIHVGIIMKNNYIIHSHGKVRIDRIDHTGIFNNDIKNYSHKLRVIKHISE